MTVADQFAHNLIADPSVQQFTVAEHMLAQVTYRLPSMQHRPYPLCLHSFGRPCTVAHCASQLASAVFTLFSPSLWLCSSLLLLLLLQLLLTV